MSTPASTVPFTVAPVGEPVSKVAEASPEVVVPVETKEPVKAPEATKEEKEYQLRLSNLAKREKAIRTEALKLQELKKVSEAPKVDEASIRAAMREEFLKDPTKFGLSYDDIANKYLNQPTPEQTVINELRQKIEALEGKQSETVKKVEESQSAAVTRALKQIEQEVNVLVDGNESYESIKTLGRQKEVVDYIKATYDEDGILLNTEQAAKEVEDYLAEQAYNEHVMYGKLKKVQAKLTPPPTPAPVVEKQVEQKQERQKQQFQTLTNRISVSTKAGGNSWAEKRARAIANIEAGKIK